MMFKTPFNKKSIPTIPLRTGRGFTLIETVVVAVLVGLVFAAGMAAMLPLMRFLNIEQSETRAADEAVIALEWIKKDAIHADDVTIGTDLNGRPLLTLGVTDYAPTPVTSENIIFSLSANGLTLNRISAAGTKRITSLIDTDDLPVYTLSSSGNRLLVEIHTKDTASEPNVKAEKRCGIMLRCRRTTP